MTDTHTDADGKRWVRVVGHPFVPNLSLSEGDRWVLERPAEPETEEWVRSEDVRAAIKKHPACYRPDGSWVNENLCDFAPHVRRLPKEPNP